MTTSSEVDVEVNIPNCFYQVDLVYGQPIDLRTGQLYPNNKLIGFAHGGTTVCPATTPGSGGGSGGSTSGGGGSAAAPVTVLPDTGDTSTWLILFGSALTALGVVITLYQRRPSRR
jgi:LPXTG-motif cell wall-anchored protein